LEGRKRWLTREKEEIGEIGRRNRAKTNMGQRGMGILEGGEVPPSGKRSRKEKGQILPKHRLGSRLRQPFIKKGPGAQISSIFTPTTGGGGGGGGGLLNFNRKQEMYSRIHKREGKEKGKTLSFGRNLRAKRHEFDRGKGPVSIHLRPKRGHLNSPKRVRLTAGMNKKDAYVSTTAWGHIGGHGLTIDAKKNLASGYIKSKTTRK